MCRGYEDDTTMVRPLFRLSPIYNISKMAACKFCRSWGRMTFNRCKTGFPQIFRRLESTSSTNLEATVPKSSWKFLILAFGVPVSSFLFYKTIVEPENAKLSEEERKVPYITRFMTKYFMEDPIENKRKIHEHIRACREVADKRLYLHHIKQKPIAPGKFREAIAKEKENVAYDTDMH